MSPKHYRSRYRVLIVEDHAPLAEATAEFMRAKGLNVRIASTGMEAMEMAAAFHPQIVLCDMRLPDMSGPDVVQALRSMPDTRDAVIAIHTAMTQSDLRGMDQHGNASANLVLSKPLTQEKLDALISRLQTHAQKKL